MPVVHTGVFIRQSKSSHSAAHGDLVVARPRTSRYDQRSFTVSGPILWNTLPPTVYELSLALSQFCTLLKTRAPDMTSENSILTVCSNSYLFEQTVETLSCDVISGPPVLLSRADEHSLRDSLGC